MRVVRKGWGCELILIEEPQYAAKLLIVFPERQCSDHYHRKKAETFIPLTSGFILELQEDNHAHRPKAFDTITIPPRFLHRFSAIGGPCVVLEISSGIPEGAEDTVRAAAGASQTTPPEDWPRLGGLAGAPELSLQRLFDGLREVLGEIVASRPVSPGSAAERGQE